MIVMTTTPTAPVTLAAAIRYAVLRSRDATPDLPAAIAAPASALARAAYWDAYNTTSATMEFPDAVWRAAVAALTLSLADLRAAAPAAA